MDIVAVLGKRGTGFWVAMGLSLIALIGVVDYRTGYEVGLSLFYLFPISVMAWFAGRRLGYAAALISALVWLGADMGAGHPYSNRIFYAWNTLIRWGIFIIVAYLLSRLRTSLDRERELARIDGLTGAVNSRFFFELLRMELDRSRRYARPFTIAYVDLDNFKAVNDRLGHGAGDDLLQAVVQLMKRGLRKTDVVARLGGDEFALLLPEIDPDGARAAITKIRSQLLADMDSRRLPVTFSIGVLTVLDGRIDPEDLIRAADGLMYSVKHAGKNSVRYEKRGDGSSAYGSTP